ncbi:hypothetical protein Tco_0765962 [Tanacetum coccineum]
MTLSKISNSILAKNPSTGKIMILERDEYLPPTLTRQTPTPVADDKRAKETAKKQLHAHNTKIINHIKIQAVLPKKNISLVSTFSHGQLDLR